VEQVGASAAKREFKARDSHGDSIYGRWLTAAKGRDGTTPGVLVGDAVRVAATQNERYPSLDAKPVWRGKW